MLKDIELDQILEGYYSLPLKIAPSDRRAKYCNFKRIHDVLGTTDLAAIVCTTPENVPYFSGYYSSDLQMMKEFTHMAITPTEGDSVFIGRPLVPGKQPCDPFVRDIRAYGRGVKPVQLLADVILEKGWGN